MRNLVGGLIACTAIGAAAWSLASATGREDTHERVSRMLAPPTREAVWETSEMFQALAFGVQAAFGVAMFGLAWARMRRPSK